MKIKQMIIACLVSVCLVSNSLASAAQYYYQGGQISSVDGGSQKTSFILIGQDRVNALSLASGQQHSQYLLADGKSNTLFLPKYSLSSMSSQYADGQITAVDYKAYGQHHADLASNDIAHFGYNSEYQDPSTRLTYLRARDYDASHQHFMTMDSYPLFNRYHFTNQDPINLIDPSGHQSFSKWWANRPDWQKGMMIGGAVVALGLLSFGIYKVRNRLPKFTVQCSKTGDKYSFKAISRQVIDNFDEHEGVNLSRVNDLSDLDLQQPNSSEQSIVHTAAQDLMLGGEWDTRLGSGSDHHYQQLVREDRQIIFSLRSKMWTMVKYMKNQEINIVTSGGEPFPHINFDFDGENLVFSAPTLAYRSVAARSYIYQQYRSDFGALTPEGSQFWLHPDYLL